MATAQGIRAGRAFVELFADDSKLVRGLKSDQKKLVRKKGSGMLCRKPLRRRGLTVGSAHGG